MQYLFLFLGLLAPLPALAVLPPDIIFSVGTQVWQIVAGLGALLFGVISAVFVGMRTIFPAVLLRHKGAILATAVTIAMGGALYTLALLARDEARTTPAPTFTATNTHRFFAERFVLLSKDEGERILVNIEANRKELPVGGYFHHYYMGDALVGETPYTFSVERSAPDEAVLSDLLFLRFARETAPDLSSRAKYTFSFPIAGSALAVETDLLTADFLIKSEPAYTKYVSLGVAHGTLAGVSREFFVMVERIYSTDSRISIFFDPSGSVRSRSVQLVLWDNAGRFYLVDRSVVDTQNSAYVSHLWGLSKDGDALQRYFDGDARFLAEPSATFIAQLGKRAEHTFALVLQHQFFASPTEGYVFGTVTDHENERPVSGLGFYHEY